MGVTNFPDGIADGGVRRVAGTVTKGTAVLALGTAATGLDTVTNCVASLATLGTGSFAVSVAPGGTGGTVVFTVNNSSAAAATVGGTIHYVAFGT